MDASGRFGYRDYVRAATAEGRTGNGVFGAKVMWGTLDEMVAKLAGVHPEFAGADLELLTQGLGRTRFVFVRRRDVIAQAVSWLRAEQTHLWYVGQTGTAGHEPRFDFDGIQGFVHTIEEHNAGWETWFRSFGVQAHLVWYEDLVADMTGTTHGILDFLGLDVAAADPIAPRHLRQADELNTAWAARYRMRAGLL